MKKKKNDIGTFFTAPIVISLVIIALIVLMSIFAPIIGPYDPDQMDMLNALQGPSLAHLFGTDQVGRDIFTRLMYGATFNVLSDNIQMYLDPTQRKLPPFKKLKKMAGGLVEE